MRFIADLRREQYEYHNKKFPYINDWKRNPYTFLKARFYMEASAVLVFFLLKTKIKPNTVTIAYGLVGLVGAVLLAIPLTVTHIIAVVIFFSKGILDWSDGHLARVTGQTSLTGHVLDVYGAMLNHLAFQVGLGFYVLFHTGNPVFYYLIPLIPFFYAVSLKAFSQKLLFEEIAERDLLLLRFQDSGKGDVKVLSGKNNFGRSSRYEKYCGWFFSFLDGRARTVDFICLFIIIEMVTKVSVTWIVFVVFFLKALVVFLGGYYLIMRKDWVEKSVNDVMTNIRHSSKEGL